MKRWNDFIGRIVPLVETLRNGRDRKIISENAFFRQTGRIISESSGCVCINSAVKLTGRWSLMNLGKKDGICRGTLRRSRPSTFPTNHFWREFVIRGLPPAGLIVKHAQYIKHDWGSRIEPNNAWSAFTICITHPNADGISRRYTYCPGIAIAKTGTRFPGNLTAAGKYFPLPFMVRTA